MAESIVQVTEGSGKKLHTFNRTIGANSVEDEVVVQGEPYLASYTVATTAGVSTATSTSHLLQIMAGASLKVRIRRIEIHQNTAATTAAIMSTSLLRVSTAGTGGTALTPSPLDQTDSASGATAMTLPTVKGTETTIIANAQPSMWQTIGASPVFPSPVTVWDFDRPRSKPLIISAGTTNGIVVKNNVAIAAAIIVVQVWFDESNF